ncbi:protein translocase subunit SecF [Patescibacteria group bacterium]
MKIINNRKIFFSISGAVVLISVLIWIAWGLNLGIDFTGGSLLEVEYVNDRDDVDVVKEKLANLDLEGLNIQPTGENGYIFRFKTIEEETHQEILTKLSSELATDDEEFTADPEARLELEDIMEDAEITASEEEIASLLEEKVVEKRFEAIGPAIGQELKSKSIWAIIIVLFAIVFYIAWAFRKVSYPVTSWKYGVVAIITLFHDILITLGVFILLGRYLGLEVNTPFVAALLTILGYSVNDTIVVFDRIRENLHKYEGEFEEIVNKSVNETITRSINTSLTTELVLLAILFFGGTTIRDFVLVLVVGILLGTYSSIFIASPLLVVWQKLDWRLKKS